MRCPEAPAGVWSPAMRSPPHFVFWLAVVALSGFVSPVPAEEPDAPAPRTKAYPWMTLEEWREFHEGDLDRAAEGAVEVLFLGDSITEAWEKTGAAVWEERIAPFRAANFGIGGDTTQNVLWRIGEGGALDRVRPKVIVLLIGTNNIGLRGDSPEAVARGVAAVVKTLRKKLPESRVLLLDLFPRGAPGDPYRQAVEATNRLLAYAVKPDRKVRRLRLWDEFMDARRNLPPTLMPDRLHLSEAGYRVWAERLTPVLREMLAER